jgi:hypothetical protein
MCNQCRKEEETRGKGEEAEKQRQQSNTRSTFETYGCNVCNISLKADETYEICIWNTLSATSDILETSRWNTCNISTKQLKHSRHANETLVKNTIQHLDQNAYNISREKLLVATSNQSYCKQQKQKGVMWGATSEKKTNATKEKRLVQQQNVYYCNNRNKPTATE